MNPQALQTSTVRGNTYLFGGFGGRDAVGLLVEGFGGGFGECWKCGVNDFQGFVCAARLGTWLTLLHLRVLRNGILGIE